MFKLQGNANCKNSHEVRQDQSPPPQLRSERGEIRRLCILQLDYFVGLEILDTSKVSMSRCLEHDEGLKFGGLDIFRIVRNCKGDICEQGNEKEGCSRVTRGEKENAKESE
jgi:hypothetical protein